MSEHYPDHSEKNEQDKNTYDVEPAKHSAEHTAHKPEKAPAKSESIDSILEKIEHEGKTAEKAAEQFKHEKPKHSDLHISRSLKSHSYAQTLKRIRKKLPSYQRPFSKFVHTPIVDGLSEAAGGTIARPSGLLMGGIFSVLGSLGVLIVCRFYGYEYNFMIGMACFVGGFFAGLIFEVFIKSYRRLRG